MEFPHRLRLSKPYRIGSEERGEQTEELVFSEPTLGSFFGLSTDPRQWTIGDYAEAAANLTGQPRSLFARMNLGDGRAVMAVVDAAMMLGMAEDPDEPGKSASSTQ